MKYFYFLIFIIVLSVRGYSQGALDSIANNLVEGQSFTKFLQTVESEKNLKFFYLEEWLQPYPSLPELNGMTIREAISTTLNDSDIDFVFLYGYAVIFYKNPSKEISRNALIKTAKEKRIEIEKIEIGTSKDYKPGKKITLRGIVLNEETNVPLPGVALFINELTIGISTNSEGSFAISLPPGEYTISLRLLNFNEKIVRLILFKEGEFKVGLRENAKLLDEVVISGQQFNTTRVSQTSIVMAELKRSPSFLGLPDLIKQIQSESGVTTASEATSGYNVRGGGTDQNLVLYDGVPIFNTAHALGFFTAFNSDVIKEATFYKGAMPSEYGGRVSSVLNLVSKEGSYQKWNGNAGIGLVSNNLSIGGPLKRDTSSLMLSFRSSYSDWVLNALKTKYKDISNSSVNFYDGSIKYTYKMTNDSKFIVSSYVSKDRFRLGSDSVNQWQNIGVALSYYKTLRPSLFYNAGIYIGQYCYQLSNHSSATNFDLDYKMLYPSVKFDFNEESTLHKKNFGTQITFYRFNPGTLRPYNESSNVVPITMPVEQSVETAFYFSDSFSWTTKLNIEAGIRLSLYNRIGRGIQYKYEPGKPREPQNTVDSINFNAGEFMKTYFGPEPRLSLNYTINEHSNLKLGYNRMYQYLHLITNTATITPVDIWQISNAYFKPQIGDQVSLGYFRDLKQGMFEMSAELYYKYIQNTLDFKNGATLILNPKLETSLLSGITKAYGVEVSINKRTGRLTGRVNYTYSRSLRKVNGKFDVEKINNGKIYPSNFDQPNVANLNWKYSVTRKVFFSGNFTYHTGRPVSLPIGGYIVNNNQISNFSDRNNFRLPAYHRLDLALIIEGNNKKKKRVESNWAFSLYNVYSRRNPYSVFFVDKGNGVLQPYQLSLIGTIVPSLTYNCKF